MSLLESTCPTTRIDSYSPVASVQIALRKVRNSRDTVKSNALGSVSEIFSALQIYNDKFSRLTVPEKSGRWHREGDKRLEGS